MRVLLHVCCACCALKALRAPELAGSQPLLFFANPNIHPLAEFRKRLKSAALLAERLGMPIEIDEEYGLVPFLRAVVGHEDSRCRICYRMRMEAAAARAEASGCEAMTTTMFASPHQDHDLLASIGRGLAAERNIGFIRGDWRDTQGLPEPPGLKLHRQQYCGCIYSEADRRAGAPAGGTCAREAAR